MESRRLEDSKNVKTSQAYFFEGFISFFEDFSLTICLMKFCREVECNVVTVKVRSCTRLGLRHSIDLIYRWEWAIDVRRINYMYPFSLFKYYFIKRERIVSIYNIFSCG